MNRSSDAFITYLGTNDFLPGVLVLNKSLRQFNRNHELVVMIDKGAVSAEKIAFLEKRDFKMVLVDGIENPNKIEDDVRGFRTTYTKLRAFELAQYRKLVYLDTDMLVCDNIEKLFKKPHMAAVSAGSMVVQEWKELNSGLVVIKPSVELYKKMYSSLTKLPSKDKSDQGFLHSFYPLWPKQKNLHLSHRFNVPAHWLEDYCLREKFEFAYIKGKLIQKNVSVVHFWGPLKPWQIRRSSVEKNTTDKYLQSVLLWWDHFDSIC